MTMPHAAKTRKEIRQIIGNICGTCIKGTCSDDGSTTTVIDTQGLRGGVDDYKGQEIIMVSGDNEGEKSRVVDYNPQSFKLTVSPAFTNATAEDDEYELHKTFTVDRLNNAINLAIIGASDEVFASKVDDSTLGTLRNEYEYTIPADFVALHTVEYSSSIKVDHLLDDCEAAWTAGTYTTCTADASFKKIGNASSKSVVVGAGTNKKICYVTIAATDISDCDRIEFWMYSSIALTAGQLTFNLDDSAAIDSSLETIDIPAMTAAIWYKHSLSLANPHSDTAIISIGIYQVEDLADFTFYIDDVHAVLAKSRIYKDLDPESWGIVQGSSPQLKLNEAAISEIGNNKRLRLSGYKLLSELSADTSEAEVDPDYIIARAVSDLLSADPKEINRVKYFTGMSEAKKLSARTSLENHTEWVSR